MKVHFSIHFSTNEMQIPHTAKSLGKQKSIPFTYHIMKIKK